MLARDDIKKILGVSGRGWAECATLPHIALLGDWMVNLAPKVTDILNDGSADVLIYSGDKDFICNWRGGEAWTDKCSWSGQADFHKQEYKEWAVGSESAGALKTYENLKFLRVFESGHMVPMNQPEAALQMLNQFISGGVKETLREDEPRMPLQW